MQTNKLKVMKLKIVSVFLFKLALITAGADKDAVSNYRDTPLHWAAYYGRTDIVQALITAGADKDARDNSGHTPLHEAAKYGLTQIVEILRAEMSYFPACTIL
jgi:ankyrin repeat protein